MKFQEYQFDPQIARIKNTRISRPYLRVDNSWTFVFEKEFLEKGRSILMEREPNVEKKIDE